MPNASFSNIIESLSNMLIQLIQKRILVSTESFGSSQLFKYPQQLNVC